MAVVGFNFTKLLAEKNEDVKGKISISNNVSIKNVEEAKLNLGKSDQSGLKFAFEFTSKYEPKAGNILIEGNLLFVGEQKEVKEVMTSWKKDKKIPEKILQGVLEVVLNKCNIEALILSRDINIPSPVPLPKVEVK
ncbi:hypothetical protein HQ529_06620 [Candidatus Woesearchaeota archaeon]|nr:hypothetical protein [Candidatus Woesearchaeota archaeon]